MNYAVDRLDRRARHAQGANALWKDYCDGIAKTDHELIGRTLRDVGWNRHAVYHYGQQWCLHPSSEKAASDYAQMAELAGFPEIGFLALLSYRARGRLKEGLHTSSPFHPTTEKQLVQQRRQQQDWLLQSAPNHGDCGCGVPTCGLVACYVPMIDMDSIFYAIELFSSIAPDNRYSGSSSQLLNDISKGIEIPDDWIPELLRFWENNNNSIVSCDSYRSISLVSQLLLVKLTYLTVPLLALESMTRIQMIDKKGVNNDDDLTQSHKSHHAYFVLIRAVSLGKRVKGHKRKLFISVWDRFTLLLQQQQEQQEQKQHQNVPSASVSCLLKESIALASSGRILPPLSYHNQFPLVSYPDMKPLFLVGDSHVLSLGWQPIQIPGHDQPWLAIPVVITGLKAWHVRQETRFFTQTNLRLMTLGRLQIKDRTNHCHNASGSSLKKTIVVVSAGEIDCREGLGGPLLQGYPTTMSCSMENHIHETVQEYVAALQMLATEGNLSILVMPVAPHIQRAKGRVIGQTWRRQTMQIWNQQLKYLLQSRELYHDVYFLDYEEHLVSSFKNHVDNDDTIIKRRRKRMICHDTSRDIQKVDTLSSSSSSSCCCILNPEYDADGTHMNAAFANHFANAIATCGCNMT